MIKNLLKNWKTTSSGMVMIIGSVVHLIFAIKDGTADEAIWTVSVTAIFAGLGLIFAGDANVPSNATVQNAQAIDAINQQGPNPLAPPVSTTPTPAQPKGTQ